MSTPQHVATAPRYIVAEHYSGMFAVTDTQHDEVRYLYADEQTAAAVAAKSNATA